MDNIQSGKGPCLDPRTLLMLLVIVNIIAFANKSIYVEVLLICFLGVLLFLCKCKKASIKWILVFCFLLIFQYYILPIAPKIILSTFSILASYVRKIFPCLMLGTLIIKKTPVRYIILALRKWHFPEKLTIPLSVTIRYFPAIKEEIGYIKDAFKLRNISKMKKLECFIVPLIISGTNTAEELSAAAVTRGIENPVKKTSVINISFKLKDYISLIIGMSLIGISFCIK